MREKRDQRELEEAARAAHDDEHLDNLMHRNIATANNLNEKEYSRLVSAELMEDSKRSFTSEDGESSPRVSWTPESSSSNQAVAWPGARELQAIARRYPNMSHDPKRARLSNVSTDPSRSPTPQPRVRKPKHKVMSVADSSEDDERTVSTPAHESKSGEANDNQERNDGAKHDKGLGSGVTKADTTKTAELEAVEPKDKAAITEHAAEPTKALVELPRTNN